MQVPGQPHDALFRATFRHVDTARGVLRVILPPEVSEVIDWTSLQIESGQFTTRDLRNQVTDLLFSALLVDGSDVRLRLLFEHQSRVDRWMPLRGLDYAMAVWRAYLGEHPEATRIPPVLPVVLHHGTGGWTASVELQELFGLSARMRAVLGPYLPSFRLRVEELARRESEDLLRLPVNAEARLVLFCLKRARAGPLFFKELPGFREVCAELELTGQGRKALEHVLRYIQMVSDMSRERVEQQILDSLGPEAKEKIVTLGEELIEQGMKKGLQEGLQEGLQKGQRELLAKLLQLKFGPLSAEALAQLDAASLERLSIFSERVLSADSVAEVFGG